MTVNYSFTIIPVKTFTHEERIQFVNDLTVFCNGYLEEKLGTDYLIRTNECAKATKDMVNHPPHYQSDSGIEVIDVIEGFVDDFESYCLGNVIKYILRYRNKNGLEDLQKAEWYLKKLIAIESTEEIKVQEALL